MDLFNKKKVAALEGEIEMLRAQIECTNKELDNLQNDVVNMYDSLTEYFSSRYNGKYFKYDSDGGMVYLHCISVFFVAGIVEIIADVNIDDSGVQRVKYEFPLAQLSKLSLISKKMFKEAAL